MEICNECGEDVSLSSKKFDGRFADPNLPIERRKLGKPFSDGDFVCAECVEKIRAAIEEFHKNKNIKAEIVKPDAEPEQQAPLQ